MSTPNPPKKSGWGSVFSNAVAGLESRLDTILADDSEASARVRISDIAEAKARAEDEAEAAWRAKNLAAQIQSVAGKEGREASRSRGNDRLAERLARATAAKKDASAVPSRTESPALTDAGAGSEGGRPSGEIEKREGEVPSGGVTTAASSEDDPKKDASVDATTAESQPVAEEPSIDNEETTTSAALLTRPSAESSTRPSLDLPRPETPSSLPNGTAPPKFPPDLESELTHLREERSHHQEELHTYLEKIDALQAKLTYLATQTVAAAKEANASTATSPDTPTTTTATATTSQLAEKDAQIATLMQEGLALSKTELRHIQTIKSLRAARAEDEKAALASRKKLDKQEQVERELRLKLRRAEAAERAAAEKAKVIAGIEREVEVLRVEREEAAEAVAKLRGQVREEKERREKVERELKGGEVERERIARLEGEIEEVGIERKLVEARAEADLKLVREELEGERRRFGVREVELKSEIAGLEGRVEAMRSRVEEAAASGEDGAGVGTGGEGNVKLLRQVETLQSQYALAKGNWETIEGSLQARVAVLEAERDESQRREAEARKKAREVVGKARKAEEEVEGYGEKVEGLERQLEGRAEEVRGLEERVEVSERALGDVKAELEKTRRGWEEEIRQRVEEERLKWQRSGSGPPTAVLPPHQQQHVLARNQSPATHSRKTSQTNFAELRRPTSSRLTSHDLSVLNTDLLQHQQQRPPTRRSSAIPNKPFSPSPPPPHPGLSRHESASSTTPNPNNPENPNSIPPTPSIEIGPEDAPSFDLTTTTTPTRLPAPHSPSPDLTTLPDILSTTTAPTTGPSVALVERMSTTIRRLETEKAASREELARLLAQRDAARDEVVALMREVEGSREAGRKVEGLEEEMGTLRGRYEAALEMLGEREEEALELRGDVSELKRLYRELVEERVGPASSAATAAAATVAKGGGK